MAAALQLLRSRASSALRAAAPCLCPAARALPPAAAVARPFGTLADFDEPDPVNPILTEIYCRQRNVITLGPRVPLISKEAWVAPSAVVVGDVDVLDGATIWYGAVVRGDVNNIHIGAFTSIGDRTVVHAAGETPDGAPANTEIGCHCIIGAGSILSSTTVGHNVVIGKSCILMEGSMISDDSKLEDGTVVLPGSFIPSKQLWGGNPAAFVADLKIDPYEKGVPDHAEEIAGLREAHQEEFLPYTTAYIEAEALKATLKAKKLKQKS